MGVDRPTLGGLKAAALQPGGHGGQDRFAEGGVLGAAEGSPADLTDHLHHAADAGDDRRRLFALQPDPAPARGNQGSQLGIVVGPAMDQAV